MARGRSLPLALLVAALPLGACAAGGAAAGAVGGEAPGQAVEVMVVNDLRPPALVTVRITSSNGVRRILGSVPPDGSRRTTYEESAFSGQYRLHAETSDGRRVESRAFTLFSESEIRWSLFTNSLTVAE